MAQSIETTIRNTIIFFQILVIGVFVCLSSYPSFNYQLPIINIVLTIICVFGVGLICAIIEAILPVVNTIITISIIMIYIQFAYIYIGLCTIAMCVIVNKIIGVW